MEGDYMIINHKNVELSKQMQFLLKYDLSFVVSAMEALISCSKSDNNKSNLGNVFYINNKNKIINDINFYYDELSELISNIRSIYPNFMMDDISNDKIINNMNSLIPSVVRPFENIRQRRIQFNIIRNMYLMDKISEISDSNEFNNAIIMQKDLLIDEFKIYLILANNELNSSNDSILNTNLFSTIKEVESIINEKEHSIVNIKQNISFSNSVKKKVLTINN